MLLFLALAFGAASGRAQSIATLIQFTNIWRYNQSGLELGTAWRTNDYDDSAWPSGRGLLGFDLPTPSLYLTHASVNTPLTISSTVTTFYFRTTFEFTGSTAGLTLIASNLVDDGCVLYLNGVRAGDVRAPVDYNGNATTLFGSPSVEGQVDTVRLTNLTALRHGENLLATEVHQIASTSADIMWGMKLMAFVQSPVVITNQPQSQMVPLGAPMSLSVGVSGGPGFFHWQKDGVTILITTNSTYSIPSAELSSAGQYRVFITNFLSAVTSSVATVTVLPDRTGPRILAAIVNSSGFDTLALPPFGSNTIHAVFSEPVSLASVRNTNNYTLTLFGSDRIVPIKVIQYSIALGARLTVDDSDPDWIAGANYILTVNNVRDTAGNPIAPDTQIAVTQFYATNLVSAGSIWSAHAASTQDPSVYDQPWHTPDYIETSFWNSGPVPFCGGALPLDPCFGLCKTRVTYQLSPTLFRTTFLWTEESLSRVILLFHGAVDDGMVVFLNGVEIWRTNAMELPNTPISASSRSAFGRYTPLCFGGVPIPVTNLIPGSNWLAAAVLQTTPFAEMDSGLILSVDAQAYRPPPSLEDSTPTLYISQLAPNAALLSWNGHGFALESTTNLNLGSASYPIGPWLQVSNQSNPFTNSLSAPARFFRLKK